MPELNVWLLYGCCATLGAAMATAATIGKKYEYKPWNCVYCLTVWWSFVSTLVFCPTTNIVEALGFWAVCHVVGYYAYNKMT